MNTEQAIERLKLDIAHNLGKVVAQHVMLNELRHDGGEDVQKVGPECVWNRTVLTDAAENFLCELDRGDTRRPSLLNTCKHIAKSELERRILPLKGKKRRESLMNQYKRTIHEEKNS